MSLTFQFSIHFSISPFSFPFLFAFHHFFSPNIQTNLISCFLLAFIIIIIILFKAFEVEVTSLLQHVTHVCVNKGKKILNLLNRPKNFLFFKKLLYSFKGVLSTLTCGVGPTHVSYTRVHTHVRGGITALGGSKNVLFFKKLLCLPEEFSLSLTGSVGP